MVEFVDELVRVARDDFGLEVQTRLPVTESFSSTVLSFVATDGRRYVVKQHWARNKAEREASALRALSDHPDVPALLGTTEHDGVVSLLIEGLDGHPWERVAAASPALLRHLGRSVAQLHRTPAESFDGLDRWHDLLVANADRYVTMVDTGHADQVRDAGLAEHGREMLVGHLGEIPDSDRPCLVHFDLRPGNVLVRSDDADRPGADELVGIIDFESCRGGHPSMDFFKLWQQVAPKVPEGVAGILDGYREAADDADAWTEPAVLDRLMTIYSAYHGVAGLAWCHSRGDFSGDFPDVNRRFIESAAAALG